MQITVNGHAINVSYLPPMDLAESRIERLRSYFRGWSTELGKAALTINTIKFSPLHGDEETRFESLLLKQKACWYVRELRRIQSPPTESLRAKRFSGLLLHHTD